MKLRIKGNSLRLRVTRTELAVLIEGGQVEEAVRFGPAPADRLAYVLRTESTTTPTAATVVTSSPTSTAANAVWAVFEGTVIRVMLSAAAMRLWREADQVGIEGRQPVGDGESLHILVEKDFACIDGPPGSEDPDAFPNPTAGRAC